MGIRFDKDTVRPTNGPMIFFSDPSSELSFSQEIRGAINSGLSFYSYRHPGDLMISFGSSEGFSPGIGTPGFVIGMFDPSLPYITIPYKGTGNCHSDLTSFTIPEISTSFNEYAVEIKEIKETLLKIETGKTVAARVATFDESIDLGATFFELSRKYPEAYVFCFATPATGCWIGASPELLLEGKNGELSTMALAGTRPSGLQQPWDDKNIEEQEMVKDYIVEVFKRNNLSPEVRDTFTKKAGDIEHICTPVTSSFVRSSLDIENLLRELSPTPALCGAPRNVALELINKCENFSRGCYGGFCGPFHSVDDFLFNVVLRCAAVDERRFCVYAGGGITVKSKTEEEWEETELKLNTFLGSVICKKN